MKKYILSLIVVSTFIGYSFFEKTTRMISTTITAPKTTTQNLTQTPTPPSNESPITSTPTNIPSMVSGYKDGVYTGNSADAFYGTIQVQATIAQGKLTTVQFLQYPNDRGESIDINSNAMPVLQQEAIQAQSAQVDTVSGASDTSQAFIQSLQSALDKAKS